MNSPSKSGYQFMGWYTKRVGGERVTETKRVQGNLNLYEHWSADLLTITWNPNYSGGKSSVQSIGYGS